MQIPTRERIYKILSGLEDFVGFVEGMHLDFANGRIGKIFNQGNVQINFTFNGLSSHASSFSWLSQGFQFHGLPRSLCTHKSLQ